MGLQRAGHDLVIEQLQKQNSPSKSRKILNRHCIGDRDQDHPQEKEMQKSKMAVKGGLRNSCEKKRTEKQRRKGKI